MTDLLVIFRTDYVCIEDHDSDLLNVQCGVPQGSILGPKLFIYT